MLTPLLFAAALHADLRPDLGWMSGYWLSCEGGREVGETWTDPRLGLMLGTSLTVRDGLAGWELSRIGPLDPTPAAPPDTPLAYFAHPEGQAVTVFPAIDAGPHRVVFEQAADDDFPKRVVYEREGDVLDARIEGVMDGQERIIRWRFQKAELNARCPRPQAD